MGNQREKFLRPNFGHEPRLKHYLARSFKTNRQRNHFFSGFFSAICTASNGEQNPKSPTISFGLEVRIFTTRNSHHISEKNTKLRLFHQSNGFINNEIGVKYKLGNQDHDHSSLSEAVLANIFAKNGFVRHKFP